MNVLVVVEQLLRRQIDIIVIEDSSKTIIFVFRTKEQKFCNRCQHEIRGDKLIEVPHKSKKGVTKKVKFGRRRQRDE